MIIVIGGGPSGMLSSYYASILGNEVMLIEKNEKLGKKLYITGKGRCNLTNNCDEEEFLKNVIRNPKFLMSSIHNFNATDTMNFFESYGLELKTERGNRVFPASDKSSDVIKTLHNAISNLCQIHLNEEVLKVTKNEDSFFVVTNKSKYIADKVIVCTGGLSYPVTGSTGFGYKLAESFGHNLIKPKPSLVGLNIKENISISQGLTLKNIVLKASLNDKIIFKELGEILITPYGISGPLVLTLSALCERIDNVKIFIDLKPALDEKTIDAKLLKLISENRNSTFRYMLNSLLPKDFISFFIERVNIDENKPLNSITQKERERIVYLLKNIELNPISTRGFDEAIVTRGGVDTKEINPKTMESKLCKGLYFAGEVIDVDAKTGGFNIQIALSTGYVAGNNV